MYYKFWRLFQHLVLTHPCPKDKGSLGQEWPAIFDDSLEISPVTLALKLKTILFNIDLQKETL